MRNLNLLGLMATMLGTAALGAADLMQPTYEEAKEKRITQNDLDKMARAEARRQRKAGNRGGVGGLKRIDDDV